VLRAVYANCLPPAGLDAELLLTDEPLVADRVTPPAALACPEDAVDPAVAHELSVAVWRLALTWFRRGGTDPTVVAGVSAGDLAATEAAITVLGPAARGALVMASYLAQGEAPGELTIVAPAGTPEGTRYDAFEGLAAGAAAAAAGRALGDPQRVRLTTSAHPDNARLRDKYARVRDPQLLLSWSPLRAAQRLAYGAATVPALARRPRGRSLLVVEYNPTRGFTRAYGARSPRRRMVRWLADPREMIAAAGKGDIARAPVTAPRRFSAHPLAGELTRDAAGLRGAAFTAAGTDLWPLVAPVLFSLVGRYARYAEHAAPRLRAQLLRFGVDAVLVPYDGNPGVRLLVRVAQSLGIPTFVVNDGYKGDEIQIEGMAADVALAWSEAIATHYFARRTGETVVTGNPKLPSGPAPAWRGLAARPPRILVGSFTFSPVDLSCRRGDGERFLDEVLAGIAAALPGVSPEVVVKLHPADEPAHLAGLVARHPALQVTVRTTGDVVTMLDEADIYLTTYSTSLLEAAQTMPVVYYRVNDQRVGAPFDRGDSFLSARTAASPAELAARLGDLTGLAAPPPSGWVERYLGAPGAEQRIIAAIESRITPGRGAAAGRRAPDGVHPG
jgi:hypothetical protein